MTKKKEGGSLPASVSLGLPLLLLVLFAVPTLLILRGSASGEPAARRICEDLLDAVRRADREAIRSLFHPDERERADALAPERPLSGVARTEPLAFHFEGEIAEAWYTVDDGNPRTPPKRITVRLRREDGRWYVTSFDQP